MRKYVLSVVLVFLIIVSLLFRGLSKFDLKIDPSVSVKEKILDKKEDEINIIVFENQKLVEKTITVKNKKFFRYDDCLNEIFENTNFISKNMEFLAIYELNDTEVLIKLNEEFKKLSPINFNGFKESVKISLKSNFPNLQKIDIQIDTIS